MLADGLIAILLVLIGAVWVDSMKALERANAVAREICAGNHLSLLDETVALAARCWVRSSSGRWVLRRTYTFDYCEDGFSRSSGFIILQGHRLVSTGLAAGNPRDAPQGTDPSGAH